MYSDSVIQAIFLGILQGLTEFLPISSSAHLLLLPWLLNWEPLGLTFDVMVHGGTLLAVVLYFRQSLKSIARQPVEIIRGREPASADSKLLLPLLIGTLPSLVLGFFLQDVITGYLRTPEMTALNLAGFGMLLWWADRRSSARRSLAAVQPLDGLIIGLFQAISLMPGVSRSGVTMTAALFLGLARGDSARFSFLLAVPVIAVATGVKGYDLLQTSSSQTPVLPLLAGVLFSSVSGFLCIKYFLRFVEKRSLRVFVLYRLLLAAFILSWLLI